MLEVKNLSISYGNINIVRDVSFALREKQWMMIVGPNGAGKSTVVKAIAKLVRYEGQIRYEGQDIKKIRAQQMARNIGVLSQQHYVGYAFTVEEVVRLGRYAYHHSAFSAETDEDVRMVEQALARTGLSDIRDQSMLTLSGGELQRTFLAQVFAQNPRLLILDEPTNHLDLIYQKQVFEMIQEWLQQDGRAVVSVVHDLSLAKAYGDSALLMAGGRVQAEGGIDDVLCRENLSRVYHMDVYGWMRDMYAIWG